MPNKIFQLKDFENNGKDKAYVPIPKAYAGRSIFITGGTGFMGKVLIEKLLRSCPDIKHIYLLIRPKRGQEIATRLTALLSEPLFDIIRKQNPKQLLKIIPIDGDITVPELGISQSNQTLLCEDVSIVFHSAATVRFDEHLKAAANINMLGTRRVIELCKRLKKLDSFIHVSTAFTNCDRSEVDEIVYDMHYKADDILLLMNGFSDEVIEKLTPSLLEKRPNTYTFTKALTEHMVLKEAMNIPADIVRPAIVTASLKEPIPGWIDNHNGATGIMASLSKGLLRAIPMNPQSTAHVVPVDIVINLLITAAWRRITNKSDELQVYNCSTQRNPITWGDYSMRTLELAKTQPLEDCLWYPKFWTDKHYIMGEPLMVDLLSLVSGRWKFISKIKRRIFSSSERVNFFTNQQWCFKVNNVVNLSRIQSPEDRKDFSFDVININWHTYLQDYVLGIRKFLFKQKPDTLESSRKRIVRLYLIDILATPLLAFGLFVLLKLKVFDLKTALINC